MSQKTKCCKDYNVKDKQLNAELYHAICTFVFLNQIKPNKRALPLIIQFLPAKSPLKEKNILSIFTNHTQTQKLLIS